MMAKEFCNTDLIVIARCLTTNQFSSLFRMNGFYHGYKIRRVKVEYRQSHGFEKGSYYILQLTAQRIIDEELETSLIRHKKIAEN